MSKLILKAVLAASIAAALAGCGPRQTVDWYSAHPSERTDKVKWCLDDAGRQAEPDCLNAIKSEQLARFAPSTPGTDFKFKAPADGGGASSPPAAPAAVTASRPADKPLEFKFKKPAANGEH